MKYEFKLIINLCVEGWSRLKPVLIGLQSCCQGKTMAVKGQLVFGSAETFANDMRKLINDDEFRCVCLDLENEAIQIP